MFDYDDVKRFGRGVWTSVLLAAAAACGRTAWRRFDEPDASGAALLALAFGFALWGILSLRELLSGPRS